MNIYHVMNHDFKQTYQHVFWNCDQFLWSTVHSVTLCHWWVKDRHLSHWVERPFDPESYVTYVAAGWARVVGHGSKCFLVSEMESEIETPMKKHENFVEHIWFKTWNFRGWTEIFYLTCVIWPSDFWIPSHASCRRRRLPKRRAERLPRGEAAGGGTWKPGWGGLVVRKYTVVNIYIHVDTCMHVYYIYDVILYYSMLYHIILCCIVSYCIVLYKLCK